MTGFKGLDSLALQADDTIGNEDTASVSIATGLTVNVPSAQVAKANATLAISGVSISDPGLSTTGNVTLTFSATHGTVNLSTAVSGGVTSGQVTSNGTGSVTVIAPLAAINATLAATSGLTYTPTSGFGGSDTLAVTAVDTLENNNSANVPLTVVGPLSITAPSTQQGVKTGGALGISGISIADPSLPTSDNVTVTFAVSSGIVTLSTSVTTGITSGQVTGNGTGSVTVTAPLAEINATLALASGLVYSPNSGFSGADSLGIAASDPVGNSTSSTASLAVAGPMSITTPTGQQAVKTNTPLGITGVAVSDPGLPTTDNVTVVFAVADGIVTLSTAVSSGVTTAQVTGNGTNDVTITAPLAAINATLTAKSGLVYTPTSAFTGTDTLSVSASDPLSNSTSGSVSLAVAGPLTITAPSAQQTVTSGIARAISGISLADPGLPTTDNVTLTLTATHGTIALSTATSGGVTSSQLTGNGTASVTITAPLAAINATLAATSGLTYTPTSSFSGADTLTLSGSDPLAGSATANVSIKVATSNTASLSGMVYDDANGDGIFDTGDTALAGVILTLTGAGSQNNSFSPLTLQTASDGSYRFTNLPSGTYTITKTQPADLIDGQATVGSLQGTAQGNDVVAGIVVGDGASGSGYNFGEDGLELSLISINLFLNSTPPAQQVLQNYVDDSYSNSSVSTNVPVGVASPVPAPTITAPTSSLAVNKGGTLAVSGVAIADSALLTTSDNVQASFAVTDGTVNVSTAVSGGVSSTRFRATPAAA